MIVPVPSVQNFMRSALLGLLLLASCSPVPGKSGGGPRSDGNFTGELQILSDIDPASHDPIEGGLGLFSVSVRNASKRCVILRDLALPDGTPILTWVNPPPRALGYDPKADEYKAESGPRSAGEAVHIGVMLPGETLVFRPQVRLLNLPRRFLLNYHSFSPDEVSQNVYFEVLGGGPLRYRRLAAADVAAIPSVKVPAATHRAVIFPYAYSPTETPKTAELVLNVEAPPRRFRLADALRSASIATPEVEESTYCVYLDAWAVRARGKGWLITPRGSTPLPRITRFELCFFHLDSIDSHLPTQFEFTGALEVRFPDRRIHPLREQERTRKLAFIAREDVAGFLKEVADKGLEVEVRAEGRSISLLLRSAAHATAPTVAFADALKRAGIASTEVVEHVWSQALGAWAVRTRTRAWHLSDRAAGSLPPIPWFAYFFRRLDELAASGEVKFAIPAEDAEAFPFAPGGVVKTADLAAFLTAVQERGLTMDVNTAEKQTAFRLRR